MFTLGLRGYNLIFFMKIIIPDISRQIYAKDTLYVLESKYSIIGSMWVNHQMEWMGGVYESFKDHDKFLIIIFLVKKTLDFYSRNFTKLSYEQFYMMESIEIEEFSIKDISTSLNIPKESARRKILELENEGVIKKFKKKMIIDKSKFYYSKPEDSIKRISRFLSNFSEMCRDEKVLSQQMTSKDLELVIKKNFSYIWKIYYELQIPMMITYKNFFKDLETFHIFAVCVVNQHLHVKNISKDLMGREEFLKNISANTEIQGINAMSIADITGIPRATVVRKLKKLVKQKNLTIDDKKHYRLTGDLIKKLLPTQREVLIRLANFSTRVFNIAIL
jgi:predicted transcriptional regulator